MNVDYEVEVTQKQNTRNDVNVKSRTVALSSASLSSSSYDKECENQSKIIKELVNLNKLIENLAQRINKVEKIVNISDIAGKLNRHYEQSRRRK